MPDFTRIAPSPTGYLHLGHVAHLLYVAGVANKLDLRVLLRMEDHDRQRCKPAYEAAILTDLRWLQVPVHIGFAGRSPDLFRQSDTPAVYADALRRLLQDGHVYACDCSRRTLLDRLGASKPGEEQPYDGYCRDRNLPVETGMALRIRVPDKAFTFQDLRLGVQTQQPARQCGDFVIRDRNGLYTYQFCVAVDDSRQGITHVVRGEDLLASTGRQLYLHQLLQTPQPLYWYHHPILTDASGAKLSKRDRPSPIAMLRAQGATPAHVLGLAAHALGWLQRPEPFTFSGLAAYV